MSEPKFAIRVSNLCRFYQVGEQEVRALDGVDLDVPAGDYVAIMGPSGSGKSTLLNQLGCLDRPTSGEYYLEGEDVTELSDDALSDIRGRRIGFVFQSYNLIPYLDALENIRMPRSYSRQVDQHSEAPFELANVVGLGDRCDHLPQQLSGGQQQRVGIARALVNDPVFILADEPTGNLDTRTTKEILDLLDRLNAEGKTIVLVTHENEVADRARRVVKMKDGRIESDERHRPVLNPKNLRETNADTTQTLGIFSFRRFRRAWRNLGKVALLSMLKHPMRSALTALGVFIGVASVVWLLAIGEGIAARAEAEIRDLGANNLIVSSLRPPDEERKSKGKYFSSYGVTEKDLNKILQTVPGISVAYPTRELNGRNIFTKDGNTRTEILGCLPNFCNLYDLQVTQGRFLSEEDNERKSEVCVLSANVSQKLFPFGDCLGKTVNVLGNLYVVVGEVGKRMDLNDNDRLGFREEFSDNVYVPIETVWAKVFDYYYRGYDGSNMYSKVTFTMEDTDKIFAVAKLLEDILESDHGMKDFQIAVPLELMEQAEKARLTFVALMGIVAAISLLVGGIGIMNIMLATVTERTREIGIRRALGARRRDVTQQFLVETVALTATGGLLGLLAGFLCEPSYSMLLTNLESFAPETYASLPAAMKEMTPSLVPWSFPLVFGIAVATGVLFGLYPARKAAAMNPVDALRHVT